MRKFVFLIHPRDIADVGRRFPGNILGEKWGMRLLPKKITNWLLPRLKGRFGFTICSQFRPFGNNIEGYIIAVLLTGKQMMTLPLKLVRQRILEAVLFAQNQLKAEVIGLGALISSLTEKGEWLSRHLEVKTSITHGDSFAVAIAEEGIEKIINDYKLSPKEIKIGIVGAYGLIGEALSMVLQKKYQLVLIGRSEVKLQRLKQELKGANEVRFSTHLSALYGADIIVTATSHPNDLIKPEHLKYGAILYDIAQPMNVSPYLIRQRPDVIKLDGCYVNLNGIDLKFDMGPPKGTTFACCAETIMQALEGENNHHVGKINLVYVNRTKQWAEKYGFNHADFSCFDRFLQKKENLSNR